MVVTIDCLNREIILFLVSKSQHSRVAKGSLEHALILRFSLNKVQAHGVLLRGDNGLIFSSKLHMKLMSKLSAQTVIDRTVHP